MKKPGIIVYHHVERFISEHIPFALYRMPWTDIPLMAIDSGDGMIILHSLTELNGKKGFLVAPFKSSVEHPIVLIPSDKVYEGWDEIEGVMKECEVSLLDKETSVRQERKEEVIADESILKGNYSVAFHKFISEIEKGRFSKLVLSRKASVALHDGLSPLDMFVDACNNYPRMMISFSYTPKTGIWIGSSPEIIVSGNGTAWNTVALAGTVPIIDEKMPTQWSEKNQHEQAYVSEYIYKVLGEYGKNINMNGPYTARAGQLAHLKTDFSFILRDTSKVGDLIHALHPTPAVCGLPKQEAYDFILANEGYDRKYYSGIIGWLDPKGTTSLYVNLRCMNIHAGVATFYAGGGILKSSEMESEWMETNHKMNTMKACLQ